MKQVSKTLDCVMQNLNKHSSSLNLAAMLDRPVHYSDIAGKDDFISLYDDHHADIWSEISIEARLLDMTPLELLQSLPGANYVTNANDFKCLMTLFVAERLSNESFISN